jgi:hypothetical protein
LIALEGHARQTLGWLIGIIVFLAVIATISDLFLRVELAFLFGSIAAAVVMSVFLTRDLRSGRHGDLGEVMQRMESEPLEI